MLILIIFILFALVILSIPSVLTYLLYRYLRKKGETHKRIGLTFFLLTTGLMIYFGIQSALSGFGFGPEHETEIVNQNIGGKLICESVYNADHHSWQYDIDYTYVRSNGDTIDFENGSYYGREWNKNEQIKKYYSWLILKTGASHSSDRLILKNIENDKSITYDIDDSFIEKYDLWKNQKIKSLSSYCCTESLIRKMTGNQVIVEYKFRTNEELPDKYGKRLIIFEFDKDSGELIMKKITNANNV